MKTLALSLSTHTGQAVNAVAIPHSYYPLKRGLMHSWAKERATRNRPKVTLVESDEGAYGLTLSGNLIRLVRKRQGDSVNV